MKKATKKAAKAAAKKPAAKKKAATGAIRKTLDGLTPAQKALWRKKVEGGKVVGFVKRKKRHVDPKKSAQARKAGKKAHTGSANAKRKASSKKPAAHRTKKNRSGMKPAAKKPAAKKATKKAA